MPINNDGGAWTDVCAVVHAGERIDGILPEVSFLGRLFHGDAGVFFKSNLIEGDGAIDVKDDAAGILADRLRFAFGEFNVLLDNLQRILRDGAFLLIFERAQNGGLNVVWNFGRSAPNQFHEGVFECDHKSWDTVGLRFRAVNKRAFWASRLSGQPFFVFGSRHLG